MDKYIPLNKRSKKAQKEYHKQQRGTWEINPVTRSVPNGKGYDRNKIKQQDRKGGRLSGFLFSSIFQGCTKYITTFDITRPSGLLTITYYFRYHNLVFTHRFMVNSAIPEGHGISKH